MVIFYILLGLVAGIFSGLIGIGGGIIMVPVLVYLFSFGQHQAQGTTLAMMLPPIGLLAAWTYFKGGYVNIPAAALLCAGFFFGGLLGAKFAVAIPHLTLQRIFGIVLFLVSLRMMFCR